MSAQDVLNIAEFFLKALGAFGLGAFATWWFGAKQEEHRRQLAFKQEQLAKFYGPVLAHLEELAECWELYETVKTNVEEYKSEHKDKKGLEEQLEDKDHGVIDYKEKLFTREIEIFTKIKDIFERAYYLAEPSAFSYHRTVVRFIENRGIIKTSGCKIELKNTGEDPRSSTVRKDLNSFYSNLADIHEQLRLQIAQGRPKDLAAVSKKLELFKFEPPQISDQE